MSIPGLPKFDSSRMWLFQSSQRHDAVLLPSAWVVTQQESMATSLTSQGLCVLDPIILKLETYSLSKAGHSCHPNLCVIEATCQKHPMWAKILHQVGIVDIHLACLQIDTSPHLRWDLSSKTGQLSHNTLMVKGPTLPFQKFDSSYGFLLQSFHISFQFNEFSALNFQQNTEGNTSPLRASLRSWSCFPCSTYWLLSAWWRVKL